MDRNNEPISALVDGEIDRRGADFLIRRLAEDVDMQRIWRGFHTQRACLQREFTGPVSLVERVHEALLEDAALPAQRSSGSRMMRTAVGSAVAASVALVAVIGLGNRVADEQPETAVQAADQRGFVSQTTALDRQFSQQAIPVGYGTSGPANEGNGRGSGPDQSRQRINRYMIRHGQAAGAAGFASFTPVLTAPSTVQLLRPVADEAVVRDRDGENPGTERGDENE